MFWRNVLPKFSGHNNKPDIQVKIVLQLTVSLSVLVQKSSWPHSSVCLECSSPSSVQERGDTGLERRTAGIWAMSESTGARRTVKESCGPWKKKNSFARVARWEDRLCGLVVRVPGHRSWSPGFDSRCYQIFWEVVVLERGPLSLVRIIEELLEWKRSGSGQESQINDRGDPLRWPRHTLYPLKLALTSLTSGGCSVGIVRLRTKGHGF
jgi:hypothetical protein